jgi:hypothetical protein
MTHIVADRVKETTSTTGTGSFTLTGAVSAFRTFASQMATSDTTWYCAVNGTEWEVGLGTLTASTTLARTTLYASSTGSAVSFTAGPVVFIDIPATAIVALASHVYIRDEKASGTAGGTATSGSFQTRTLNTKVSDARGLATLASNQITLAAGTYIVFARAPALGVAQHQARLQNVTAGTTLIVGTASYSDISTPSQSDSFIQGVITVAASQALEIQHRVATTASGNGFGVDGTFGVTNVFSEITFRKVA